MCVNVCMKRHLPRPWSEIQTSIVVYNRPNQQSFVLSLRCTCVKQEPEIPISPCCPTPRTPFRIMKYKGDVSLHGGGSVRPRRIRRYQTDVVVNFQPTHATRRDREWLAGWLGPRKPGRREPGCSATKLCPATKSVHVVQDLESALDKPPGRSATMTINSQRLPLLPNAPVVVII